MVYVGSGQVYSFSSRSHVIYFELLTANLNKYKQIRKTKALLELRSEQ